MSVANGLILSTDNSFFGKFSIEIKSRLFKTSKFKVFYETWLCNNNFQINITAQIKASIK